MLPGLVQLPRYSSCLILFGSLPRLPAQLKDHRLITEVHQSSPSCHHSFSPSHKRVLSLCPSTTVRYIKSPFNLFPPIKEPTLPWDITLILNALRKSPFKPMGSCFLLHMSIKTFFLIAITLSWGLGELGALRVDPLYVVVYQNKMTLSIRPFLLKVSSEFHINQ